MSESSEEILSWRAQYPIPVESLKNLRLYVPLKGEVERYDYWSSENFELQADDLVQYQEVIQSALERERIPEEAERGWMHWYRERDEIDRKVYSVTMECECRKGQLWGVAVCKIREELTLQEMVELKEYITGQCSDGWGEGFEQRPIKTEDGELLVHLWQPQGWSIKTEHERFGMSQQSTGVTIGL